MTNHLLSIKKLQNNTKNDMQQRLRCQSPIIQKRSICLQDTPFSLYRFIVFHCIACSHPCSRCSDFRSFSRIALPAKMPLPQRSESYNPKFPFAHLIQTADSALDILQMQISTQSHIASRQPVPPKDRCPAPVSLPPLPPYKGYKAA